jgi:ABC-type lipoprotein export system ATPase subunit
MANILQEIRAWSSNLPYWEQAALDKIIGGIEITDEVIEELYKYLLEDSGLNALPSSGRPTLCNLQPDAEAVTTNTERPLLKRIYNLKNINALVPNQELSFGPQLTAIFGANGSGKSGYARVIGCAAFTRGDKEILPDVTKTAAVEDPLCADIELLFGDKTTTIHYVVGETCPQLRSFYVFDSTSVKNHLTKENPMSFSPGGLDVLTQLSVVTDRVRKRLQVECEKKPTVNIYESLFIGNSQVKALVTTLDAASDVEVLKKLAKLTTEEVKGIATRELAIAELRNQKIAEQIQELGQKIIDLRLLEACLEKITSRISSETISTINASIAAWGEAKTLSQATSVDSFRTETFTQTGSEFWDKFIRAAYALGQAESLAYPEAGDQCLLCHQPLTTDARNLILRVWKYLQSEAQERLDQSEITLQRYINDLKALDFSILNDQTVSYRHLSASNPDLLAQVTAFLKACEARRNGITQTINSHQTYQLDRLPNSGLDLIRGLVDSLETEKLALENKKVEEEIERLEKEKRELEHRRLLSEHLDDILLFVANAKWIQRATESKVRRSTKHITKKYNDLFEQLISQEYITLFEETLAKLKCPLGVMIETHGSKGETWKQIALKREDEQVISGTSPDQVLSEGEQRAVALADFLTEVALDENSAGILLDDPVSSLDFDWKGIIAQQVVDEAKRQQVIVFTHDLHFLYLLKKFAETENLNIRSHWIQKRNNIPGWVYLDNSPISEKEYRKPTKAKEYLDKAKVSGTRDANEEQDCLEQGFGALRTTYEIFVMRELFGEVLTRWEERISGDRLKNVYVDEGIRDEVIENTGRLSRYITAHSHSDVYVAQKPTCSMLEDEIKKFEDLQIRNKQIKREHGIKD